MRLFGSLARGDAQAGSDVDFRRHIPVSARRSDDDLLADILDAAKVGAQTGERGRGVLDADPVIRFAAEAVLGRIVDAASELGTEVKETASGVPGEK